MKSRIVRTESGRVIDTSSPSFMELIDGKWVRPTKSMFGEELMNGRILSDEELSKLLKSGK